MYVINHLGSRNLWKGKPNALNEQREIQYTHQFNNNKSIKKRSRMQFLAYQKPTQQHDQHRQFQKYPQ